jgi:predicted nucleic acid-binding protein
MRDIVIDASVAAKWFLDEPHSTEALDILKKVLDDELSLLAPDHIYAEIGNTLWRRTSAGTVVVSDAQDFISDFLRIKITLVSTADLLSDAYHLAITHKRSMYDSLYLALSQREQCQFVTADEKLVNVVGSAMSDVVLLANWS